ncbi:hypothetical protein SLEP1_g28250 [Rubroshorea leprosula]|uniref:Complex 1 LYR protein domain-containing protein n=1 Tax=Rubroshorea leprosula TaxID=152421 RepID=A0AAV5JZ48_9ROSI|nr:hypothetical protein SLEP1_g28250 [Rubroshorea leprosula]
MQVEMITNLQKKCRSLVILLKFFHHHDFVPLRRLLHNGPDTVDELLDRHIVMKEKSLNDEEEELQNKRRLTSNRREALSLYRDSLRATRFFMWSDARGVVWRVTEFEEARYEKDPEIITRLLIGGRDAVESALEKLAEKQRQQIAKERGGGDRPRRRMQLKIKSNL